MTLSYAMTSQACRVHRALPAELKARVDKLILGLRLAPKAGRYDQDKQQFSMDWHTDAEIMRIRYRVIEEGNPQLVVLDIRLFSKTALAGVYERLRAERQAVLTG